MAGTVSKTFLVVTRHVWEGEKQKKTVLDLKNGWMDVVNTTQIVVFYKDLSSSRCLFGPHIITK